MAALLRIVSNAMRYTIASASLLESGTPRQAATVHFSHEAALKHIWSSRFMN